MFSNFDTMKFLEISGYFLAVINPASKVFLLASMNPPYSRQELWKVSLKSSLAAFLILSILSIFGNFILTKLFSINIYSLKIAGGLVLFTVGLQAVRNGRFYEKNDMLNVSDLCIVPLAAPLIAGPAAIAAGISMASIHGMPLTILSIAAAILVNMLLMLTSLTIGRTLERIQAFGPIVRITGLIVMAMSVQMVLNGSGEWLRTVF